jgi:hypothetical protein
MDPISADAVVKLTIAAIAGAVGAYTASWWIERSARARRARAFDELDKIAAEDRPALRTEDAMHRLETHVIKLDDAGVPYCETCRNRYGWYPDQRG